MLKVIFGYNQKGKLIARYFDKELECFRVRFQKEDGNWGSSWESTLRPWTEMDIIDPQEIKEGSFKYKPLDKFFVFEENLFKEK